MPPEKIIRRILPSRNPLNISKAGFPAPGSSSDRAFPPKKISRKWHHAAFVPGYGNGWHAMDLHHLSFYPGFSGFVAEKPGTLLQVNNS
jgi:hypothetical protein